MGRTVLKKENDIGFDDTRNNAFDDARDDSPHEECGVFGVWAPELDVSRLTYFGLRSLQHRGQDAAGIAVGDGSTVLIRKDLGLVSDVFNEADLSALTGKVAIGHVRYGTSGARSWEAAQPHISAIGDTLLALAHNGTLVNSDQLRIELLNLGVPFRSNTDSEVAAKLIGYFTQQTNHLRVGIAHTMEMIEGGYAVAAITNNALYAFRDPRGIRPLIIGQFKDGRGWVVASETCALGIVGAEYVRDVEPGEIIRISDDGLKSRQGIKPLERASCIFEHVYFSRPDSVVGNRSFYATRSEMGRQLAREAPVDCDLVISVPDSGTPAAEGFAAELNLPYGSGMVKNRYVARTFIEPTDELRALGVRLKLSSVPDMVRGKRIVMIDDSIVRGTTSRQIVTMMRDAGATEVHMRIASPETKWPCFYGIDTATQDQLISARKHVDEVCEMIGADSLAFLSMEGLLSCVPPGGYCDACFTGAYPVEIPPRFSTGKFLEGFKPNNLHRASPSSQMQIQEVLLATQDSTAQGSASRTSVVQERVTRDSGTQKYCSQQSRL